MIYINRSHCSGPVIQLRISFQPTKGRKRTAQEGFIDLNIENTFHLLEYHSEIVTEGIQKMWRDGRRYLEITCRIMKCVMTCCMITVESWHKERVKYSWCLT